MPVTDATLPTVPATPHVAPAPVGATASAASCRPSTLGGELRISVSRLFRQLRHQKGEADLSDSQYAVLAYLGKCGPVSPGALAEHERMRPPSMTRTVNALEALGLVRKDEHPTDGRQVLVSITPAGVSELRETRRRRDAWLTRQLTALTPEERGVLAQANELLLRISSR